MADDRLTTYAEVAEMLGNLPLLMREARRARRLSLRAAGQQMPDLTYTTLTRMENGGGFNVKSALAVLRWLDAPAAPTEGQR